MVSGFQAIASAAVGLRVFLAHAGEDKPTVVDTINTLLRTVHAIDATFLDEHSIPSGMEEHLPFIIDQLLAADVGACVPGSPIVAATNHETETRPARDPQDCFAGDTLRW